MARLGLVLVRNDQQINFQTQGVPANCDWASALWLQRHSESAFFWDTLYLNILKGITNKILATSLNDKYFSYFKMSSISLFTNMFCELSWETEVLFDCSFAFVLLQLHPYVPWLSRSSDQSKELFFDHSLQTTFTSLYSTTFTFSTTQTHSGLLSLSSASSLQQTLFLYASAANTSNLDEGIIENKKSSQPTFMHL